MALIFVFGPKGGSKGSDGSVPLGYSAVVYDDQYTYFLSRTEDDEACIKRVGNDLHGKPKILYEVKKLKAMGGASIPWAVCSSGTTKSALSNSQVPQSRATMNTKFTGSAKTARKTAPL